MAERDGTDFNPLISSLVQLLLDADCRKVLGFQALVEREFVALGHKFSQRCHVVSSKDTEQVKKIAAIFIFLEYLCLFSFTIPDQIKHWMIFIWKMILILFW